VEVIEIIYSKEDAVELNNFVEMDYYAVNQLGLSIELMMENAGLQLANLIANSTHKDKTVKIGVGKGNNGGGGLVAARRLSGWGYKVFLDQPFEEYRDLTKLQLERALKFGAKEEPCQTPDVWVDAYLGFSQHLPLPSFLLKTIDEANNSQATKIALDIPTGFLGDVDSKHFLAEKILTLAAPKKILYNLPISNEIFVADIGIPVQMYDKFHVKVMPFNKNNILKIKR